MFHWTSLKRLKKKVQAVQTAQIVQAGQENARAKLLVLNDLSEAKRLTA
jgi:hypothetical protein